MEWSRRESSRLRFRSARHTLQSRSPKTCTLSGPAMANPSRPKREQLISRLWNRSFRTVSRWTQALSLMWLLRHSCPTSVKSAYTARTKRSALASLISSSTLTRSRKLKKLSSLVRRPCTTLWTIKCSLGIKIATQAPLSLLRSKLNRYFNQRHQGQPLGATRHNYREGRPRGKFSQQLSRRMKGKSKQI